MFRLSREYWTLTIVLSLLIFIGVKNATSSLARRERVETLQEEIDTTREEATVLFSRVVELQRQVRNEKRQIMGALQWSDANEIKDMVDGGRPLFERLADLKGEKELVDESIAEKEAELEAARAEARGLGYCAGFFVALAFMSLMVLIGTRFSQRLDATEDSQQRPIDPFAN